MKRTALVLAVTCLALASCGGGDAGDTEQAATDVQVTAENATEDTAEATTEDVGQYDQTWSLSYDQTTCAQWLGEMDEHQRYVAGADMLLGAARTENDSAGLPPDPKIDEFTQQISTACSAEATLSLTDAATALVLIDPSLYAY
jgi:hypothetical protein